MEERPVQSQRARFELASVVEDVGRKRIGRIVRAGSAAFAVSFAVLAASTAAVSDHWTVGSFLSIGASFTFAILGPLAYLVARVLPSVRVARFGSIAVWSGSIAVDRDDGGVLAIARKDVSSGWMEETGAVHLVLRDRSEVVLQPKAEDVRAAGAALLAALGLSARQKAVELELGDAWGTGARVGLGALSVLAWIATILTLLMIGSSFGQHAFHRDYLYMGPIAAGFLAARAGLGRVMRKRRIQIGTDGVRIRRLREQFIPIEKISSVEERDTGASLVLVDGTIIALPDDPERDEMDRRSYVARLRETLAARGQGDALAVLDRGARSKDEWIAHLTNLMVSEGDYRRARVDAPTLERVVEDGAAPVERRIGAAIALASTGDAPTKQRIRLAAQASVDEELRAALELAAEGEVNEGRLAQRLARR